MIVATYKTSDGVTIHIDDKYAVDRESVEGKRIIAEQNRIAHRILMNYLQSKEKEQESKQG